MVVLARGDAEVASWPLAGQDRPDLAVVGQLVRWQLWAGRLGCSIYLRDPPADLLALLELVGLAEIVPCGRAALRQVGGETEGSEQPGIEEVVVPHDPIT